MSDSATQSANNPISSPSSPNAGPPGAAMPRALRLWPGVALVAVMWLAWGAAIIGEPSFLKFFIGMIIAPLVVLVGILVWWLFASRLRWADRLLVTGTFVAMVLVTVCLSFKEFPPLWGMVPYALPKVLSAWVGWLVLSFFLSWPVRRAGLVLIFVASAAACCSLRVEGMDGEFVTDFGWRWMPKSEQAFLTELKARSAKGTSAQGAVVQGKTEGREEPGDWPGFRGPRRDARLLGVRIKTDWQTSPPQELWRRRIGPGWSSFAVVGDQLFTQEQRGPDEYVVCYDAASGAEVWTDHDATRFEESAAGPGPRATPTYHAGRLYTYGANSHLNCLDAVSGKPLWSHDVATEFKSAEAEKDIPMWGFASSPLVTHGMVIVFAGARNGKTVVAYNEENGELAWTANVGPAAEKPEKVALSYCSPQLAIVEGVEQVLLATDAGLSGFEPAHGKELWHYSWPTQGVARIVQPGLIGEGDLLLGTGMDYGTRRIHVSRKGDEWLADEVWTTSKYKPYFNDFVVFNDNLYGFDTGGKFVCLSLADGSERWRVRDYGAGQVLLLADQGLLLILSEKGDVALRVATPEKRDELCRFKALEGKTWNHPVIAHGKLFVRNGEEMAGFKLELLDDGNAGKKVVAAAP